MKLFTGFVMAAMLMVTSAHAQQNFNLGIKGGVNFYNISDESSTFDMKTGFHAGLLGHIHMSERFGLQPELVYSLQGANLPDGVKLNLGYINVPVLFQYMFNNGFRLQAGPQLGFLINAKTESGGNSEDVKNNFKSTDFALAVGVGFVNPSGFGFDARYNYGLSNISEPESSTYKNGGFQLGVFYLLKHRD